MRVRLYSFSDTGTNGVPNETYTFSAERWGRRTFVRGRQVSVGMQSEGQADAVVELGDEVEVPVNGLLKVEGEAFFIREILARPLTRSQVAVCERVRQALPNVVEG